VVDPIAKRAWDVGYWLWLRRDATNTVIAEAVMEKSEFDDYFAVLGKASDQTRSVLYVFIIVYIAMLLYGLNAFVIPKGSSSMIN
jgi:hypothetical protein